MENGEPKHIWTLLSLKEYFERILLEHKEANANALNIRTQETERRLELLNNHAGRIQQILDTCLPRSEYNIYHEQLTKDVHELQKFKIIMDTKASQSSVYWAYALSILTTILAIIALVHEFTK